jgi:hypothetical protein
MKEYMLKRTDNILLEYDDHRQSKDMFCEGGESVATLARMVDAWKNT